MIENNIFDKNIAKKETIKNKSRIIEFSDELIPLKMRKIELLKQYNLPVPETSYLKVGDEKRMKDIILSKIEKIIGPVIIRVACTPEQQSMPFFYIDRDAGIDNAIEKLIDLKNSNYAIKYYIIQEATKQEDIENKISGRIIYEHGKNMPREEILEIYKGSRSTGILNSVDTSSENYMRFEKNAGGFMKPVLKMVADSKINNGEIHDIYNILNSFKEKLNAVKELIKKSRKTDDMDICFEFSYTKGGFIFSDIDY